MSLNDRVLKLCERWALSLAERGRSQNLWDSNHNIGIVRHFPLWFDEFITEDFRRLSGHPWWAPFNMFLHQWKASDTGMPHNHPRWNMTLVLTGALTEVCDRRVYFHKPGSIVFRSPYSFHKLFVPKGYEDKTYTLFFVGRRNYTQQLLRPDGSKAHWYPFDHWIYGHPQSEVRT